MKSIDFRVMYFLILYALLSRLALWVERIAVKVVIVDLSLTIYMIFFLKKMFSFFIMDYAPDLHDLYKTYA